MKPNFNELAKRCYKNAVRCGSWKNKPGNGRYRSLVIAEIADMAEADRIGRYSPKADMMKDGFDKDIFEKYYKDTVEDEMEDIAIRLLDFAGACCMNLSFNVSDINDIKTSFDLHSVTANAFTFCRGITSYLFPSVHNIIRSLLYLFVWAEFSVRVAEYGTNGGNSQAN